MIQRLHAAVFVVIMFSCAVGIAFDEVKEAPIVPDSRPLEENRYVSSRNYEETLLFYRRFFKTRRGVRWRNIVHLPTIKAKHIENLRRKGNWDGINIYEHKGEVRLYVLKRAEKSSK